MNIGSRIGRFILCPLLGLAIWIVCDVLIRAAVPSRAVAGFIVNLLIGLPVMVAAFVMGIGGSWLKARQLTVSVMLLLLVAVPLVPGVLGGLAGLLAPEVYGVDGTLAVTECRLMASPSALCGQFSSERLRGVRRIEVPLERETVERNHLGPDTVVAARLFASEPFPGGDVAVMIRPPPRNLSILRAWARCAAAGAAWALALGLIRRRYRREHGGMGAFWRPGTTLFRGRRFGSTCLALGIATAVVGVPAAMTTFAWEISSTSPADHHRLIGLATGDWLTVIGVGVGLFMWGRSEAGWTTAQLRPISNLMLSISVLYALLVSIALTYVFVGESLRDLVPPEMLPSTRATFQPLARAGETFDLPLLVSNLALSIALLGFSMSLAAGSTGRRGRSSRDRAPDVSFIRSRGVPEVLCQLAPGAMAEGELRSHLPFAQSVQSVRRNLELLSQRGLVETVPAMDEMHWRLTDKGARLAAGLAELVS